jgi:predicted hydrolase (HD superfamily)
VTLLLILIQAALLLVSTKEMAYLDEVMADLNVHVALAFLLGHWRGSHISKHTVSLSTAMSYSTPPLAKDESHLAKWV